MALAVSLTLCPEMTQAADFRADTTDSRINRATSSNADKTIGTPSDADVKTDDYLTDEDGFLLDGNVIDDEFLPDGGLTATESNAIQKTNAAAVDAVTGKKAVSGSLTGTGVEHVSIRSEEWEAAVIEQPLPVEFMFIIDATGSMGPYIADVKENIGTFAQKLVEKDINTNMSVMVYKDVDADGSDSTEAYFYDGEFWNREAEPVVSILDDIRVSGGGDTPEIPQDALNEYLKMLREQGASSTDKKHRFVFLLTDAGYKDSTSDTAIPSIKALTSNFRSLGVKVSVVSKTTYKSDYTGLYSLTGGKFIDIKSDDYYKMMLELADWVTEVVTDEDSDKDGLWDKWEEEGIDIDLDGTIDIKLKDLGADKNVRDIFIEVDWFTGCKPPQDALDMVAEVFKNHGINMHIDPGFP